MLYEAIDHVVVPTHSLETAAAPFERLGLRISPPLRHPGSGVTTRGLSAGGATNLFTILWAAVTDPGHAAQSALGQMTETALRSRPGAFGLGLRVRSLDAARRELSSKGIAVEPLEVRDANGSKLYDIAPLPPQPEADIPLALLQYVQAEPERRAALEADGALQHSLALKRLDHLAAVAPELERATRHWNDVLGIPTWGEIVTPTTVIRQMKVGDAIVELLGPANADSPIHSRQPGLSSMTAFEVPDLAAAVATARAAGFSASDPAVGSLPGTRVARIPAEELSGLTLQLLEYV